MLFNVFINASTRYNFKKANFEGMKEFILKENLTESVKMTQNKHGRQYLLVLTVLSKPLYPQ